MMTDEFSFGIEEEYFLADLASGRTPASDRLDRFHEAAESRVESASHELLKGQVEVQTEPGTSLDAARDVLADRRGALARIAAAEGMGIFAAGTHPLGFEGEQSTTQKQRYQQLEAEFGLIATRAITCAMHVHVAVPEPDRRVDLMLRVMPFVPLFYALSTSSPFWEGRQSRLKGFRLAVFSEWPRMGLPELFRDDGEYHAFIDRLVRGGAIENSSFVWWLIRPSNKFPTIELRVCDSCTRLDDAVAIAALYRALLRAVHRRPDLNAGVGPIDRGITAENIWQAQQGGLEAKFVDARDGSVLTVPDALEAAIAICAEDADALGCAAWVARTRDILARGTSADRQIEGLRREEPAVPEAHLQAIVTRLIAETAL